MLVSEKGANTLLYIFSLIWAVFEKMIVTF